jgi:DNA-binding NtrC family response regulator
MLVDLIQQGRMGARIIATVDFAKPVVENLNDPGESTKSQNAAPEIESALIGAISTITIRLPNLADRLEDLPILAQFFLEACNRSNSKQIGSIRPDALDSLALYSWPGELDQLREMIELAHAACGSHTITSSDLPPIFYQAFQASAHKRQQSEPIVLDELLASIEREAITRALAQTSGNKSEAATLLGMTRPRLYRRLVQLGFVTEEPGAKTEAEAPEFIEHDGSE